MSKNSREFVWLGNLLQEYPDLRNQLRQGEQTPEEYKQIFAERTAGTLQSFDVNTYVIALLDNIPEPTT